MTTGLVREKAEPKENCPMAVMRGTELKKEHTGFFSFINMKH